VDASKWELAMQEK
jgi:hypothetical protein